MRHALHAAIEWGCRWIGNPVRQGPANRRSVALTFDDGPSPGTMLLLEELARHGAKATFFQCGLNVLRHREIARAVRDAGHEIGNHSYSHARLAPRPSWSPNLHTPGFVCREFAAAQKIFRDELGISPRVMRVPYGIEWFGTARASRSLGLRDIAWTVIGHDWEWPPQRTVDHLLAHLVPGAIICLHDGRDVQPAPDISTAVEAVRQAVPLLAAQGYSLETVSQLLDPGPNPKSCLS